MMSAFQTSSNVQHSPPAETVKLLTLKKINCCQHVATPDPSGDAFPGGGEDERLRRGRDVRPRRRELSTLLNPSLAVFKPTSMATESLVSVCFLVGNAPGCWLSEPA